MQRDPSLQDLPYEIELNAWGQVEMSPASVRHGWLPVPWASADFRRRHSGSSPLPQAPENCVEVISPSNVVAEIEGKTRAYLAAGAREVWLVYEHGKIRYIDHCGEKAQKGYP